MSSAYVQWMKRTPFIMVILWLASNCQESLPTFSSAEEALVPEWVRNTLDHPEKAQLIFDNNPGWRYFIEGDYLRARRYFRTREEAASEARVMFNLSLFYRNMAEIQADALKKYFVERARLQLAPHRELAVLRRRLQSWSQERRFEIEAKPLRMLHPKVWSPCLRARDLASQVGCGSPNGLESKLEELQQKIDEPIVQLEIRDGVTQSVTVLRFFDPLAALGLADGYLRLALRRIKLRAPKALYNQVCATRPKICRPSEPLVDTLEVSDRIRLWAFWVDPLSSTPSSFSDKFIEGKQEQMFSWARRAQQAVRRRVTRNMVSEELSVDWRLGYLAKVSIERRWAEVLAEQGKCEEALYAYQMTLQAKQEQSLSSINTPVVWSRIAALALCVQHYPTAVMALHALEKMYPIAACSLEMVKLWRVSQLIDMSDGYQGRGS